MTLGILGGCGPEAGAHLYAHLIAATAADCDSAHIDVCLSGRASTPDRTAYLLGRGGASPLPSLVRDARWLAAGGAELLLLPCHTAHAFFFELQSAVSVPILHMIHETVAEAREAGVCRLGVLCTEGTRAARLYDVAAQAAGLSLAYPDAAAQAALSESIYHHLKAGRAGGEDGVLSALTSLRAQGCEAAVLACTELSLPSAALSASPLPCLDALALLGRRAILLCGKKIKEDLADAVWRPAFHTLTRPSAELGACVAHH